MKLRLSLTVSVVVAMALALAGVLRDVSPTRANIPLPVQPFAPDAIGGVNTTQLGQKITANFTSTQILAGERTTTPWIFSGPGFSVDLDKNIPAGQDVGSIWATIDVNCDGGVDYLYDVCPNDSTVPPTEGTALRWKEATTVVQGTTDAFLLPAMPPYSWLARHKADITHVCLDRSGIQTGSVSVLNTVYTTIPFSPNGGAGVASTLLGGAPNGPPSTICLDTPNTSESTTSLVNNPIPQGDNDGPCIPMPGINQCADAGIYGMWTRNRVDVTGPFPASTIVPVEKHIVNNGPLEGAFREHWDAESMNPGIIAEWVSSGSSVANTDVILPPNADLPTPMSLEITCNASGWGLVVIKNILWPQTMPVGPLGATKDTYLDDNAFTFVIQVVCGATPAIPLVDKEVAFIAPIEMDKVHRAPDHVVANDPVIVFVDELKENHSEVNQPGQEYLVAEAPDVIAPVGPDILVEWLGGISVEASDQPGSPQIVPVSPCTLPDPDADSCVTFPVDEWPGQADVLATLGVQCAPGTPPGIYPVVIKAIDVPLAGFESKPSDNAQRRVISVWCGPIAKDDIDDATGLYPRWSMFQSAGASHLGAAPDIRKPYKSPPGLPQDIGYVERLIQLDCYWIDLNGCYTDVGGTIPCDSAGDGDGFISAAESWLDYDLVSIGGIGAVDADGDCLAAPNKVQPGHPVDAVPTASGTSCDSSPNWFHYSENPVHVVHDPAADQDCDGIVDGIEKAWGSNPLLADSDGDGSADFVEMLLFTNPLNPDTDGDGFKDRPANVYGDNVNTDMDNCPTIANPTQVNTDGHRRPAGTRIAGTTVTSNPLQDKLGDACDSDNDNDLALNAYEVLQGTNPFNMDTDGDTVNDGAELRGAALTPPDPNAKPLDPTKKPAWNSVQQVYYRGCHINVNDTDYPAFSEQDGTTDGVEMDVDGDGVLCPTDLDSDNGGEAHAAKTEINDSVESFGYATMIARADTDGDGCEDWVEIHDINGDRKVTVTDQLFLSKRFSGSTPGDDPVSDRIYDMNKDTRITVGDLLQLAKNTCSQKPWGGCPVCPPEN